MNRKSMLGILAGALLLPAAASAQAGDPPADSAAERFTLGNRFRSGFGRKYRVHGVMTTDAGRQRSQDHNVDRVLQNQPDPPPEVTTLEFVEEERCLAVDAQGVADISYGVLSFWIRDELEGKTTFDCRVNSRADLPRIANVPRVLHLGALMEGSIRFRIDPRLQVLDLTLPNAIAGAANKALVEDFKRNLQSRYAAFFPSRPVAVGDEWKSAVSTGEHFFMAASMVPESRMSCLARFEAVTTHRDQRAARVGIDLALEVKPGTVVAENATSKVVADALRGHSTIIFSLDSGTPLEEESVLLFKMRRVTGMKNTATVEVPVEVQQRITATWVGTDAFESK